MNSQGRSGPVCGLGPAANRVAPMNPLGHRAGRSLHNAPQVGPCMLMICLHKFPRLFILRTHGVTASATAETGEVHARNLGMQWPVHKHTHTHSGHALQQLHVCTHCMVAHGCGCSVCTCAHVWQQPQVAPFASMCSRRGHQVMKNLDKSAWLHGGSWWKHGVQVRGCFLVS